MRTDPEEFARAIGTLLLRYPGMAEKFVERCEAVDREIAERDLHTTKK